jgi:hypothetical protein
VCGSCNVLKFGSSHESALVVQEVTTCPAQTAGPIKDSTAAEFC